MKIPNIPPLARKENYEDDWGFVDFQDKTVLDIGADYGSTAAFFLKKGAKKVISVERVQGRCGKMGRYFEGDDRVVPICLNVSCGDDYKELLEQYDIDMMKVDCEGCEAYLLDLDNEHFSQVPEYVIEMHNLANSKRAGNPHNHGNDLVRPFREKFKECGYTTKLYKPHHWVLYARKDLQQ